MPAADLSRFAMAQAGGVFERALAEIEAGRKTSHWMWFVFPQIAGLGQSPTARHYAIHSLDEARAYLADPVLDARLMRCVSALAALPTADAERVFGGIDAVKLRSSLTLFEAAADVEGGAGAFGAAIDRWYGGSRDPATLRLIG